MINYYRTCLNKIDRLLTPQRVSYAYLLAGALWTAWLVSILAGPGYLDLTGNVAGADYIQFYAAGQTLRYNNEEFLYNFEHQYSAEKQIAQADFDGYHAFLYPPFLAWLFVPFSVLPYLWSFALWSLLGLTGLWLGLRSIQAAHPKRKFAWALTFYPIFATISFGQNSLLSFFLFCLVYAQWKQGRTLLAGLIASLLLYKPQLVIGLGFLWLLEWRQEWRAILGLILGGSMLAGMTAILLPHASRDYLTLARTILPRMSALEGFPFYHAFMLRAFFTLLLPDNPVIGELLALAFTLAGVVGFILFWKQHRHNKELMYAVMICLTLWIIPYVMTYDWAILLIPAILLWDHQPKLRRQWKSVFAMMWLAVLLSSPLTLAQRAILPFAFQISVPVFAWAMIMAARLLEQRAGQESTALVAA